MMSRFFAKPFVTHADKSPAFWQIGILWQIMATGVRTDNKFALLDQVMEQYGAGPTTHTHVQDEGLYVVKGRCTFNAGGIHGISAGPGTFVAVPGLTEHSFIVEEEGTRMLNFYTPAGFELLLMGVSLPAEERRPPPKGLVKSRWVTNQLNEDYGVWNKYSDVLVDGPNPEHMKTEATPGATVFPFAKNIADSDENYWHGNALWGLLAAGAKTGDSYTLFEIRLRQGSLHGPRNFAKRDVMMFVISGRMTVWYGNKPEEVSDGALVWIPHATVHSIRTDSEQARCLYFQSPGGFDSYIQLVGMPSKGVDPPPASFKDKTVNDAVKQNLMNTIRMQEVLVTDPLDGNIP